MDAPRLEGSLAGRLRRAFDRGSGHGLLQLGAEEAGTALPPVYAYWREFGARYVTALCTQPDIDARQGDVGVPPPSADELEWHILGAPPMTGSEYLNTAVLETLWRETDAALRVELAESRSGIQDYLKSRNPAWNLVGRVHFNVAENRKDAEAPFAFLATYTTRLSAQAKPQHLPLGQALREYAGAANKSKLLSLLLPVQRAGESCPWLKAMVDAGEIFHPLGWARTRCSTSAWR
jgi:non-specific serine/threonine protein kinase